MPPWPRVTAVASSRPASLWTETTKVLDLELDVKGSSEWMQTPARRDCRRSAGDTGSSSEETAEAAPRAGHRPEAEWPARLWCVPAWGLCLSLRREIQGEGRAFHSHFRLHRGVGQGSKNVPNVIQRPVNFICFPLFHPNVCNVIIPLSLSF